MIFSTALLTCRERTAIDWIAAITADLATMAWVGALIIWWL